MQADKPIHHLGGDPLRREMAPCQPTREVLSDSEILLDGAAQVSSALQIVGKIGKDYAQMVGGHPPPNIGTEKCDSFHASLGTKGFSRPRHDSFTPSGKKEKP
jgi:hypothetical protein